MRRPESVRGGKRFENPYAEYLYNNLPKDILPPGRLASATETLRLRQPFVQKLNWAIKRVTSKRRLSLNVPSEHRSLTNVAIPTSKEETTQRKSAAPLIEHGHENRLLKDPRWLSKVKERVGRCIMFGLDADGVKQAGRIMAVLAKEWKGMLVGCEGFLSGPGHAGLERQKVVWGEMDSMVGASAPRGESVGLLSCGG